MALEDRADAEVTTNKEVGLVATANDEQSRRLLKIDEMKTVEQGCFRARGDAVLGC